MKIDYQKLDQLVGKILEAHKSDEVNLGQAVGAISHVVAAVAQGEKDTATKWVNDPAVFDRWLADVKAGTLF